MRTALSTSDFASATFSIVFGALNKTTFGPFDTCALFGSFLGASLGAFNAGKKLFIITAYNIFGVKINIIRQIFIFVKI